MIKDLKRFTLGTSWSENRGQVLAQVLVMSAVLIFVAVLLLRVGLQQHTLGRHAQGQTTATMSAQEAMDAVNDAWSAQGQNCASSVGVPSGSTVVCCSATGSGTTIGCDQSAAGSCKNGGVAHHHAHHGSLLFPGCTCFVGPNSGSAGSPSINAFGSPNGPEAEVDASYCAGPGACLAPPGFPGPSASQKLPALTCGLQATSFAVF